jgi:peroxiredoxin
VTVLAAGTQVPDFVLTTEDGEEFSRSDLLGKTTILVFYPFAFSPVCTDQLALYDEVREELESEHDAVIYGVSCDSSWSQKAFREKLGVGIPQLSDFEPKGATCRSLGVLHEGGFPQRALLIVDPDGTVRFSYQAESPGELPGVNLIFDGLRSSS